MLAALVLGGCCDAPGDYTRSVSSPGVRGEVRLRTACSDGCSHEAAQGSVRLVDDVGAVVAEGQIDAARGSFAIEAPVGPYQLEIAPLGAEVDRSLELEISDSSGLEVGRTYDERFGFRELFVLFADGVTQANQEDLLSSEPGIYLDTPVGDSRYQILVDEHPQLVGEYLDSRYGEVVGFEMSEIGCPHGGS